MRSVMIRCSIRAALAAIELLIVRLSNGGTLVLPIEDNGISQPIHGDCREGLLLAGPAMGGVSHQPAQGTEVSSSARPASSPDKEPTSRSWTRGIVELHVERLYRIDRQMRIEHPHRIQSSASNVCRPKRGPQFKAGAPSGNCKRADTARALVLAKIMKVGVGNFTAAPYPSRVCAPKSYRKPLDVAPAISFSEQPYPGIALRDLCSFFERCKEMTDLSSTAVHDFSRLKCRLLRTEQLICSNTEFAGVQFS
jgi:hypothetical protein